MVDRRHKELTDDDIGKISDTYHTWRGEVKGKKYEDVAGFCKSASLEEIRKHEWILTPGRYVGTEQKEESDEKFEDKMNDLISNLSKQMTQGRKLDDEIRKNLEKIGYGF